MNQPTETEFVRTPLSQFTADMRFLIASAGRILEFIDPIAIQLDEFQTPLLSRAIRGPVMPLDGVLMRDWDRHSRRLTPGVSFGLRPYTLEGIRFARVYAYCDHNSPITGYEFFVVDRPKYQAFFRLARRCRNERYPAGPPPVLSAKIQEAILKNTVGFLEADRLKRVIALGGRAKRGLLLSGPPGNGKTSACRWVWQQCESVGLEYRIVTPDDYRAAREACNPAAAVRRLFEVDRAGVIFFDDLDMALRDRSSLENPEDQAIFLGALDGIRPTTGAVYVFTTNLSTRQIDPAFLRPGRIDVILDFPKPDAELRKALFARWNHDLRLAVDEDQYLRDTHELSFAEIEELKNLLIMNFVESGFWDWPQALAEFHGLRDKHDRSSEKRVGFISAGPIGNGHSFVK